MTRPTRTGPNLPGPGTVVAVANEAETKQMERRPVGGAWPRRERLTDAVSPYLLEAADARPGQRVCDIGCGGGALTIALARRRRARAAGPSGSTSRHRCSSWPGAGPAEAGVANVRFVEMDVQTGASAGEPFDLAVSQFGVMFFDEPTAAFGAIRASSRPAGASCSPAGRASSTTPGTSAPRCGRCSRRRPVPPPGKSPVGPFALGDDEYVRDLLGAAGFAAVESTPHETTVRAPAERRGRPRRCFPFMGVPPEREDEAHGAGRAPSRPVRGAGPTSTSTRWPSGSTRPSTAVTSWPATAGRRCRRSSGSPKARRWRSSERPPA